MSQILTPHKIYNGDLIKSNEMGWSNSTYGRGNMHTGFCV
jgi:hypothetical protein